MRSSISIVLFGISLVIAQKDKAFESFMSNLSYNWQNEFPDLRYQVARLQQDDPAKYNELVAQLGLKAGSQISIPSQFNYAWASQFVMAAGIYKPTAHQEANPQEAKPTGNTDKTDGDSFQSALGMLTGFDQTNTATKINSNNKDDHNDGGELSSVVIVNEEDNKSRTSTSTTPTRSSSTRSTGPTSKSSDINNDDDNDNNKDSKASQQFGNPIVGSINKDNVQIIPSGQGYSGAQHLIPSIPLLVILSFF
ncbi:hypothetical protein LPJ66_005555 [Kickxella alabastrina]|uniref:Uncharacterized protein n=1 Tax=Kickxella alabastrina TaxID=61397 RepID=A0ACC1IEW9_9FUNG|nr:hypothetical protein LPJ66_005555 [Kickxella alabastrina]